MHAPFLDFQGKGRCMKLKYAFENVDMGDEIVFVPVGEQAQEVHGVLKANSSGKEILDLLQEETTEDEIVEKLSKSYEADRDALVSCVRKTMETLRNEGLLSE